MSAIPLEVERRFEQRWAARFFLPNKSRRQHSQRPKRTQVTGPPQEPKEKAAVIEQRALGLRRWPERGTKAPRPQSAVRHQPLPVALPVHSAPGASLVALRQDAADLGRHDRLLLGG